MRAHNADTGIALFCLHRTGGESGAGGAERMHIRIAVICCAERTEREAGLMNTGPPVWLAVN